MLLRLRSRSPTRVIGVVCALFILHPSASYSLTAVSTGIQPNLKNFSLQQIQIPESYGTVQESFLGKKNRTVIVLQDAHVNYECQKNHARILEHLSRDGAAAVPELVAVEGAEGPVVAARYAAIPEEPVRRETAEYFMKEGRLSGAEYFSAFEPARFPIVGVEERELYLSNLAHFQAVQLGGAEARAAMESCRQFLTALAPLVFSKEALDFHGSAEKYAAGEVELSAYAGLLDGLAERHGISLDAYPQFKNVVETLAIEGRILPKRVDQERLALIEALERRLPKEDVSLLVTSSLQFRTGAISSAQFHRTLAELAGAAGLDAAKAYPQLSLYMEVVQKHAQVRTKVLFREIAALESAAREKLLRRPEEKALAAAFEETRFLENLSRLELMRDEVEDLGRRGSGAEIAKLAAFCREQAAARKLPAPQLPDTGDLSAALESPRRFYADALKRDRAMFDRLMREMESRGAAMAVLVVGGFHARGISDLLERENISHLIVMPRLSGHDDARYLSVMLNERIPLERLFERRGARLGPALQNAVDYLLDDEAGLELGAQAQAAFTALAQAVFSEPLRGKLRELASARQRGRTDDVARLVAEIAALKDQENTQMQARFEKILADLQVRGTLSPEQAARVPNPIEVQIDGEAVAKAEGIFNVPIAVKGVGLSLIFPDRGPADKADPRDAQAVRKLADTAAMKSGAPAQPLQVAGLPGSVVSRPASPLAVAQDISGAVGAALARLDKKSPTDLVSQRLGKPFQLRGKDLPRQVSQILDPLFAELAAAERLPGVRREDLPKIAATIREWLGRVGEEHKIALIHDVNIAAAANKSHADIDKTVIEFNLSTLIEVANAVHTSVESRRLSAEQASGIFDVFLLGHELGHKNITEQISEHYEEALNRVGDMRRLMERRDWSAVLAGARKVGLVTPAYETSVRKALSGELAREKGRRLTTEDLIEEATWAMVQQYFDFYFTRADESERRGVSREAVDNPLILFYEKFLKPIYVEITPGLREVNAATIGAWEKPSRESPLFQAMVARIAAAGRNPSIAGGAQAVLARANIVPALPATPLGSVMLASLRTGIGNAVPGNPRLTVTVNADGSVVLSQTIPGESAPRRLKLETQGAGPKASDLIREVYVISRTMADGKKVTATGLKLDGDNYVELIDLLKPGNFRWSQGSLAARDFKAIQTTGGYEPDAVRRFVGALPRERGMLSSPVRVERGPAFDAQLREFALFVVANRAALRQNPRLRILANSDEFSDFVGEYHNPRLAEILLRTLRSRSIGDKTWYDLLADGYLSYMTSFSTDLINIQRALKTRDSYATRLRSVESSLALIDQFLTVETRKKLQDSLKKYAAATQDKSPEEIENGRENVRESILREAFGATTDNPYFSFLAQNISSLLVATENLGKQVNSKTRRDFKSALDNFSQNLRRERVRLRSEITLLADRLNRHDDLNPQLENWETRINETIGSLPEEARRRYSSIWEISVDAPDVRLARLIDEAFRYHLEFAGVREGGILYGILDKGLLGIREQNQGLYFQLSVLREPVERGEAAAPGGAEVARLSYDPLYHETQVDDVVQINLFWLTDFQARLERRWEELAENSPERERLLRWARSFVDEFVLGHENYHSRFDNRVFNQNLGISVDETLVLEEVFNLYASVERLILNPRAPMESLNAARKFRLWFEMGVIDEQLYRLLDALVELRDQRNAEGQEFLSTADWFPIVYAFVLNRNPQLRETAESWTRRSRVPRMEEAETLRTNREFFQSRGVALPEQLVGFRSLSAGLRRVERLQGDILNYFIQLMESDRIIELAGSPEEIESLSQMISVLPAEMQNRLIGSLRESIQTNVLPQLIVSTLERYADPATAFQWQRRYFAVLSIMNLLFDNELVNPEIKQQFFTEKLTALYEEIARDTPIGSELLGQVYAALPVRSQQRVLTLLREGKLKEVLDATAQYFSQEGGAPSVSLSNAKVVESVHGFFTDLPRPTSLENLTPQTRRVYDQRRAIQNLFLSMPLLPLHSHYVNPDNLIQLASFAVADAVLSEPAQRRARLREFQSRFEELSLPDTVEWQNARAQALQLFATEIESAGFLATFPEYNETQLRDRIAEFGVESLNRILADLPEEAPLARRLVAEGMEAESLYLRIQSNQQVEDFSHEETLLGRLTQQNGRVLISVEEGEGAPQQILLRLPDGAVAARPRVVALNGVRTLQFDILSAGGNLLSRAGSIPLNAILASQRTFSVAGETGEIEFEAVPFVARADPGREAKAIRLRILRAVQTLSLDALREELKRYNAEQLSDANLFLDPEIYARERELIRQRKEWALLRDLVRTPTDFSAQDSDGTNFGFEYRFDIRRQKVVFVVVFQRKGSRERQEAVLYADFIHSLGQINPEISGDGKTLLLRVREAGSGFDKTISLHLKALFNANQEIMVTASQQNAIFLNVEKAVPLAAAGGRVLGSPLLVQEAIAQPEVVRALRNKLGLSHDQVSDLLNADTLDDAARVILKDGLQSKLANQNATDENLKALGISDPLRRILMESFEKRNFNGRDARLVANLDHGAHANVEEEVIELNLLALYALDTAVQVNPAAVRNIVEILLVGHEDRHFVRTGYPAEFEELENQIEDIRELVRLPNALEVVSLLRKLKLAQEDVAGLYERAVARFNETKNTEAAIEAVLEDLAKSINGDYNYEKFAQTAKDFLLAQLQGFRIREFRDRLLEALLERSDRELLAILGEFGISAEELRLFREEGEIQPLRRQFELKLNYDPTGLLQLFFAKGVLDLKQVRMLVDLATGRPPGVKSVDAAVEAAAFDAVSASVRRMDEAAAERTVRALMNPDQEATEFAVFDLANVIGPDGAALPDERIAVLQDPNQLRELQRLAAAERKSLGVNWVETSRTEKADPETGETVYDAKIESIKTDEQIGLKIGELIGKLEELQKTKPGEFARYEKVFALLKSLQQGSPVGADPGDTAERYRTRTFMNKVERAYQSHAERKGRPIQPKDVTVLTTVTVFKGLYFRQEGDFWFTLTSADKLIVTSRLLAHVQNNKGELPPALIQLLDKEGVVELVPVITYSGKELDRRIRAQAEYEKKA